MKQRGVTLIELVMAIVIVGVAVAGVLSIFVQTTAASADPMIRHQAIAIAEAYLEEAMLKSFSDPDEPESGSCEEGATAADRPTWDDVSDYDCVADNGARDQNGNAIASLSRYAVTVNVTGEALNGIGAADAKRIDVTVQHAAIGSVALSGYRTNY